MSNASRPDFTTGSRTCTNNVDTGGAWSSYYTLADAVKAGEGCPVVVKSRDTNTGKIYVAKNVSASKMSPFRLNPGESVELRVKDLSGILVGAEVAGEIADYIVEL